MIPSVLTHQLCQEGKDFLDTTFPIATSHFHGLYRGPYQQSLIFSRFKCPV